MICARTMQLPPPSRQTSVWTNADLGGCDVVGDALSTTKYREEEQQRLAVKAYDC